MLTLGAVFFDILVWQLDDLVGEGKVVGWLFFVIGGCGKWEAGDMELSQGEKEDDLDSETNDTRWRNLLKPATDSRNSPTISLFFSILRSIIIYPRRVLARVKKVHPDVQGKAPPGLQAYQTWTHFTNVHYIADLSNGL